MTKSKFFWPSVAFIVIFILFVFFRLINLNIIPVFVDEAIYVRWSQVMRAEATLRFLPLSDGKQPLFMWLTIPFLKFISDPLIAGRLVSFFAGFGSLIGIAYLSWLLFKKTWFSAIATFLYATLPFTVFFDRMALADSLLNMFGLWTLIFAILFARSKRLDQSMILGFIIGGGLITKSPAIIFYLWTFLALVFFGNLKKLDKKSFKDLLLGTLAILIISQGIYSVLRLGPGFSQIGSRNQDYVFSISEVLSHPLNPLVGNLKSTANWLWLLFTPPIFILIFLSFIKSKHLPEKLFILFVSLAPLFAQGLIAKVYTSRYILFASAPLILLATAGTCFLINSKNKILNLITSLILLTPLSISLIYVFQPAQAPMSSEMRSGYLEKWTAGWGNQEISEYFISLEASGKKVVAFTEGYFGTMPDGLQIYTQGHPNITIVGSPPDVNKIPEGLLNTDPANERFLIVNKSRNHLSELDLSKLVLEKEFVKPYTLGNEPETLQLYRLPSNSL